MTSLLRLRFPCPSASCCGSFIDVEELPQDRGCIDNRGDHQYGGSVDSCRWSLLIVCLSLCLDLSRLLCLLWRRNSCLLPLLQWWPLSVCWPSQPPLGHSSGLRPPTGLSYKRCWVDFISRETHAWEINLPLDPVESNWFYRPLPRSNRKKETAILLISSSSPDL